MLTLEQVKARSASKMVGLNPTVLSAAQKLIERCYNRGVLIQIVQGYRSIAEQDALYAQGRTKAGQIVTNARGGDSYHNYGVAIDFALLMPDGRSVSWDTSRDGDGDRVADWMEVVAEAKALGFAWGGDWTGFKDFPHFEMTFGLSVKDFKNGKRPTAAEGEELDMNKGDVDFILSVLGYYWGKMDGNKAVQDETHRIANELRKATGRPAE